MFKQGDQHAQQVRYGAPAPTTDTPLQLGLSTCNQLHIKPAGGVVSYIDQVNNQLAHNPRIGADQSPEPVDHVVGPGVGVKQLSVG